MKSNIILRLILLPLYMYRTTMKEIYFKKYLNEYISYGYSESARKYRKYKNHIQKMEEKHLKETP